MDYIRFLDKAKENLKAAEICFQEDLYNASINRAYYSMFHAAIAALANEDIKTTKERIDHDWVQSQFSESLIKKKKIYPSLRGFLPDVQTHRNYADYTLRSFGNKKTGRILRKAKTFVEKIEKEIRKNGKS